jgi:hypothetical protein
MLIALSMAATLGACGGGTTSPASPPHADSSPSEVPSEPETELLRIHVPGEAESRVTQFDLNRDGAGEIIEAGDPSECGTGGWPWKILDGRDQRLIPEFFGGSIYVRREQVNGWHVLMVSGRGGAGDEGVTIYVFDREQYTARDSHPLNPTSSEAGSTKNKLS